MWEVQSPKTVEFSIHYVRPVAFTEYLDIKRHNHTIKYRYLLSTVFVVDGTSLPFKSPIQHSFPTEKNISIHFNQVFSIKGGQMITFCFQWKETIIPKYDFNLQRGYLIQEKNQDDFKHYIIQKISTIESAEQSIKNKW